MEHLNQAFAALADPTRRGIIDRLAQGEATVSELVDQFDLTQPTISSHIKVLESAGLITRSRRAQKRPCKLEPDGLTAVNAWLERLRANWERNFARLDDVLEDLKVQPFPEEQKS